MSPTVSHHRFFTFTFAKGVVLFAMMCGAVLFHFRDRARRTTGPRHLFAVASTLEKKGAQAPTALSTLPRTSSHAEGHVEPHAKALVLVAPLHAKVLLPYKRHAIRKRPAKKVLTKRRTPINSALDHAEPKWVDENLNAEEAKAASEAEQAYDVFDLAQERLQEALNEPSLVEDLSVSGSIPWQFDQSELADREIPSVQPYGEFVPHYVRNSFSEIRDRLASLSREAETLPNLPKTPQSAVAKDSEEPVLAPSDTKGTRAAISIAAAEPSLVQPSTTPLTELREAQPRDLKEDAPSAHGPGASATVSTIGSAALASAVPVAETAVDSGPMLVAPSTPILASVGAVGVVSQTFLSAPRLGSHAAPHSTVPIAVVNTPKTSSQPTVVNPAIHTVRENPRIGDTRTGDTRTIDEMLYGEIGVDGELSTWLVSNKAHIELNLRPVGSRDPQDTVFVDYQYPSPEFQMDTRDMSGAYRLLADIYTAKSRAPYSQVVYPTVISADTAKKKVRFRLTMQEIEDHKIASLTRRRSLELSGALFEGASGDYRDPKAIGQGEIEVVGFPEWGPFRTDPDGTFHIPNVPSGSELLVRVSANGYYPTFKTIPTFATDIYSPVYLISKDKVDFITRYFTHHVQGTIRSLVMGRVFDTTTRNPLKDERLSLSSRRGGPIYFGALGALPMVPGASGSLTGDLATTENGMFAFFNVQPSVRTLSRASGKPGMLIDFHPQSAYYVEMGRGGVRGLRGRILDRKIPVPARVRLVGDKNIEADTDEGGNFLLPNLDLPPGVVTLEIEAKGYPLTWQSVSWNPREPEVEHLFYMVPEDLVYEGAASAARVNVDSRLGHLVGHNSIFPKQVQCVHVSLLDSEGRAVSENSGPFSMTDQKDSNSPLCLSRRDPWFSFFNLTPGEYILKLVQEGGRPIRSHIVRVGSGRVSISVN